MSDLFDGNSQNSNEDIQQISIYDEMKRSYLDYAMSVIVSRALPDVRDGLKPVHRRILYTMYESKYFNNKPFKKSAHIVGDVMGKYHPHGDTAIYDSLVRMAQEFSLRLPLIAGQGNFGSMDGDNAAAMRYTEAKMAKISHYLVEDIDKDTVSWRPNYDDSLTEPVVLPSRFPNLLVNGTSGIAVGMATNIPTHNLGELIDGLMLLIDNPETTMYDLSQVIQGPDFPTGGKIIGRAGIEKAFATGKGIIAISGVAHIEEKKNKQVIIITEVPWQVNKSKMVEEIASIKDRSENKELDVISSVRDESDRNGVRVVVELKKDSEPELVMNYLQKYTSFKVSFGINMLAIHDGVPKLMNLKEILTYFLDFRKEVVKKRTIYLLGRARNKAHILLGLGIAVENIDEIILLIKASASSSEAKAKLLAKKWTVNSSLLSYVSLIHEGETPLVLTSEGEHNHFYQLSEEQANAILELRLHRLTALERDKIETDLTALIKEIEEYLSILSSYEKLMLIIKEELLAIKDQFATPRKTLIEDNYNEMVEEDFIKQEQVVIMFTKSGYIKRMPVDAYRSQKRGGRGKIGMNTKEGDMVTEVIITDSHADILFFTSKGLVYKIKCYRIQEASFTSLGRAVVNLIPIAKDEKITTILAMEKDADYDNFDIVFATANGNIRRNHLIDFLNIQSKGKIAMKLDEGDSLLSVRLITDNDDILLNSQKGRCIRFPVNKLRVFASRNSSGVRGILLDEQEKVVNMSLLKHEEVENTDIRDQYLSYALSQRRSSDTEFELANKNDQNQDLFVLYQDLAQREEFVLTVTSKGYGKRTSAYEYRITNRGGKGFLAGKASSKAGDIIASFVVEDADEIIMISNKGQVIRQKVASIRMVSRLSIGVLLFRLADDEYVVSASVIKQEISDLVEDAEE